MALTSAITVPVSHIIIRNYIGENLSWSDAGYWQGMWYISTMYLLIITTALSVYYLPRLSSISEKKYIKKEIIYGYKIVIPIAIVLSLLVYTFRYAIIEVAFTADFYQMEVLFKWQLIGDIIKIFAWILGYVLIAKAMSAVYIYTEIIFSILFVLSSIYFLDKFGLIGMSYSFAFYNLIYSIYLIVILNVYFFNKSDAQ
jgi:polysaccharide transporter, PST family